MLETVFQSPLGAMMACLMAPDCQKATPRWKSMVCHLAPKNLMVYLMAQLMEHSKMAIRKDLDSVELFQLVQETEQALVLENPSVHLRAQESV